MMHPVRKTSTVLRRYSKMLLGQLIMTLQVYMCDIWMLHFKEHRILPKDRSPLPQCGKNYLILI